MKYWMTVGDGWKRQVLFSKASFMQGKQEIPEPAISRILIP